MRADPSLCTHARPCQRDNDSANPKIQALGSHRAVDIGPRLLQLPSPEPQDGRCFVFCALLACHINTLCGRLACFKKGLNGFATLAVCLVLHVALGGEA